MGWESSWLIQQCDKKKLRFWDALPQKTPYKKSIMPRHQIEDMLLHHYAANAVARVVLLLPKVNHIGGAVCDLHWLPVEYQIQFKILLLTFKCRSGSAPIYLREMLCDYVPPEPIRSSKVKFLFKVPRTKCKTLDCSEFMTWGGGGFDPDGLSKTSTPPLKTSAEF